jgi:hypothetical protein
MNNRIRDLVAVFLALSSLPSTMAEDTTFCPSDDCYVDEYSPSGNTGSLTHACVRNAFGGGGTSNWEDDTLIRFDLSSWPAGTPVGSAGGSRRTLR